MIIDILEYSIEGLKRRQLRSWLTIIGIVIGVLAIVLLISIALGLESDVKSQLSFFGPDVIVVSPSAPGGAGGSFVAVKNKLSEEDVKSIEKLGYAQVVTPVLNGQVMLDYRGKTARVQVMGLGMDFLKVYPAFSRMEGREFKTGETGVIALGHDLAYGFFNENIALNRRVTVENRSFNVVSILDSSAGGFGSFVNLGVYVPYADARDLLPQYKGTRYVSEIHIKAKPGVDINAFKTAIEAELDNNHKVTKDTRDFTVVTSEIIMQRIGNVFALLSLFLGGMAGIALLVGSIGVANTMFMSVMERTREIGILKAIGADDSTIRNIFLVESGLIGLIGGTIGVLLGVGIVLVLNQFGVPALVTPELIIGAMAFSFIIGVVSGYIPAKNAASLPAVEALRFD